MNKVIKASLFASLFLLLSGCQTPPQTKALLVASNQEYNRYSIPNVPFYPQQAFFCGPTTLAEVLNFYGNDHRPEDIAPATFIPDLEGTLQIEMVAGARKNGLLAYATRGSLTQILGLVKDNIPVIVLQNNSISLFPMWHYALVIGYDIPEQEIILHTGATRAHKLRFATFERTWARGNYWFLAAVPGSVGSEYFDRFIYTKAAQDLLSTGQPAAGIMALERATEQWTDYWLPYFLLANYYLSTSPETALHWYKKGDMLAHSAARTQVPYLNNYAYALAKLGCREQAKTLIDYALIRALESELENLLDTQEQILRAPQLGGSYCEVTNIN